MNKLHILILRKLTEQESIKVRSFEKNINVSIVTTSALKEKYQTSKTYTLLTEEEKKRINYEIFSKILEFGDTIVGDQTISQHFNIRGVSLWYYHKFRIYFKVRNRQYEIEEINKNISGATSIIIFTEAESIHPSDFASKAIEFIYPPRIKYQKVSLWSISQYGFAVILRFIKSILTPISRIKNKQILCIDTADQYKNILGLKGNSTVFENAYLGYLYQTKGAQMGFIDQLLVPKFSGRERYKLKSKHLKNHNNRTRILGEQIMVAGLFSIYVLRNVLRIKNELFKKYEFIKKTVDHHPLNSKILKEFISLNSTSLFYSFKYFSYLKFFKKNKFSAILTTDENSSNFKTILDAAKANEIFTVGYQHGSIHELHPAYMYSKADISQKPMPDLTITWGKKWNNLLINKGNYPSEMIKSAGQIRTDVINNLEQNSEITKETIFKNIEEKHLILFATQPQRDPSLRLKAAEDVVIACKKLRKKTHLIFKLHPRENDPEFYIHVAEKYGLKNYTISTTEDLYVLLKISSLVITCFSTVGTEALYFSKPLIILDHLKQDVLNYIKDGVAFQAINAIELRNCIDDILSGKLSVDKKVLEAYILESSYKIDGKTSERVWKILTTKSNILKNNH